MGSGIAGHLANAGVEVELLDVVVGLVEPIVGLVPAGGGCKEIMLDRGRPLRN